MYVCLSVRRPPPLFFWGSGLQARASRPGQSFQTGPGPLARAPGQSLQARAFRPGPPGQGVQARASRLGRSGQGLQARPGPPGQAKPPRLGTPGLT